MLTNERSITKLVWLTTAIDTEILSQFCYVDAADIEVINYPYTLGSIVQGLQKTAFRVCKTLTKTRTRYSSMCNNIKFTGYNNNSRFALFYHHYFCSSIA